MNRIETFQRKLFNNPTTAEVFLYGKLKEHFSEQQKQYRFSLVNKQVLIGWYIVDFLLPHKTLIIELDGKQHFTLNGRADDTIRDGWLKEIGFDVLRYSNNDIFKHCDEIVEYVDSWRSLDNPLGCFFESKRAIKTANKLQRQGRLQRFAKSGELI